MPYNKGHFYSVMSAGPFGATLWKWVSSAGLAVPSEAAEAAWEGLIDNFQGLGIPSI